MTVVRPIPGRFVVWDRRYAGPWRRVTSHEAVRFGDWLMTRCGLPREIRRGDGLWCSPTFVPVSCGRCLQRP